jgi:predicted CoA-substrate-specific enzyme activase
MIIAGCDIGSRTAKAVIMENNKILADAVILSDAVPSKAADEVMNIALKSAGLNFKDLDYVVGTGYGKEQISFVDAVESEISCHAKGAFHIMPNARMVIDIGGQDSKATRMDDDGKVVRYTYNDKCATGTGRFLEVMADALEVPLEKMGEVGATSKEELGISNQCVIFAETEVVSLVNDGKKACDIINALHHALSKRVSAMARSIGVEQDIVMTGGVAKNSGVFNAISDALGLPLKAVEGVDPQIMGALGAALFASEKVREKVPA